MPPATGIAFRPGGGFLDVNATYPATAFNALAVPVSNWGSPSAAAYAVVFNAAGDAFLAKGAGIEKFNANGSSLGVVATTGILPTSMDLAADQCTMFYTGSTGPNRIHRVSVCDGGALPDFGPALPAGNVGDVRILRDGGALVTVGGDVIRLSASGAIQKTYHLSSQDVPHLALAADGLSFWAAGNFELFRVTLANGTIAEYVNTQGHSTFEALAVAGDHNLVAAPTVPTASGPTLLMLAALLATIGLTVARQPHV